MVDHSIGKVYVELDLDPSRYTKGQQQLLKDATTTSLNIEKNFKNLGIKSSAEMDLMRAKISNSFEMIANNSKATANDIVRAEKAKNEQLSKLNEQQYGHHTSIIESIKKNWLAAAAAITAAWYTVSKVIGSVKDIVLTAARYETLGIVMRVVGNNAGYTGEQMEELAGKLEKTGISMSGSRQALVRMAQAQLDLSKAAQLARIAQDAAVIGAMNSTEAFNNMVYGIQSANVRVLRTIGINVSFEESYQRVAKTLGRTTTSFTEAEKAAIRLDTVLAAGPTIAGAYEAAMETAGKQLLTLERHFENLKVLIGLAFTPALAEIVETITGAVTDLNGELSGPSKKAIEEWGVKFRVTLIDVEIAIMRVAMFLDRVGGSLSTVQMLLTGPGAALGIESSVKRFEAAAKTNMEYEDRHEATAREITKLLEKQKTLEESLTEAGKARAKAAADELEKKRLAAAAAAKAVGAAPEVDEKLAAKRIAFAEKLEAMRISLIKDQTNRELEEEALKTKKLLDEAKELGISKSYILHMSEEAQQLIREKGYERERKLQDDQKAMALQLEKDLFQIRVGTDNEYSKQELARMTMSIDLAKLEADKKTAIFNRPENEKIEILKFYSEKEKAIIQKATAEIIRIKQEASEAATIKAFDEYQDQLTVIWERRLANAEEGRKALKDTAAEYYSLTNNIEQLVEIQRRETEATLDNARAKGFLTAELENQIRYIGEVKALEIKLAPFKGMIDEIGKLWGDVFANMASGTKSFSETFQESMKSLQSAFIQMVTQMIAKWVMFQAITGIFGGKTASALGLSNPLPFAEGGIVTRPTVAMIGEAGPEMVIPLRGGQVPIEMKKPVSQGSLTINIPISIDSRNKKLETDLRREMESTALKVIQRHM